MVMVAMRCANCGSTATYKVERSDRPGQWAVYCEECYRMIRRLYASTGVEYDGREMVGPLDGPDCDDWKDEDK